MKRPRKKVLFVDDEKRVHDYASSVSKRMGLGAKHAFSPAEARKVIAIRIKAVRRLMSSKKAALAKEKDPAKGKKMRKQIKILEGMLRNPFNLVVSDINMPRGNPTGMNFARKIKKHFPNQEILMHSDDFENLELLEQELGIKSVYKSGQREKDLEEGIGQIMGKRRKKERQPKKPAPNTD